MPSLSELFCKVRWCVVARLSKTTVAVLKNLNSKDYVFLAKSCKFTYILTLTPSTHKIENAALSSSVCRNSPNFKKNLNIFF